MKQFYVYVLLDPRKPGFYEYGFGESALRFDYEPFYVGKGSGDRWQHHFRKNKESNFLKARTINCIKETRQEPLVVFPLHTTDESIAYACEDEIIDTIGKKLERRGPLTNIADGNANSSSALWDTARREQRSMESKARWATPGYRENLSALHKERHATEEYKVKHKVACKKAWEDLEVRERRTKIAQDLGAAPEFREKMRQITSARYEDEEWKAMMHVKVIERSKDPEWLAKLSKISSERFSNKEERIKISMHTIKTRWVVEDKTGRQVVVYRLSKFIEETGVRKSTILGTHKGRYKYANPGYKIVEHESLPNNWMETGLYDEYLQLEAQSYADEYHFALLNKGAK